MEMLRFANFYAAEKTRAVGAQRGLLRLEQIPREVRPRASL